MFLCSVGTTDIVLAEVGVGMFIRSGITYKIVFQVFELGCISLFIVVNFNTVQILFGVVYLSNGTLLNLSTIIDTFFLSIPKFPFDLILTPNSLRLPKRMIFVLSVPSLMYLSYIIPCPRIVTLVEDLPHSRYGFIEFRDSNNINWDRLFSFLKSFDSNAMFNSIDINEKCSYSLLMCTYW